MPVYKSAYDIIWNFVVSKGRKSARRQVMHAEKIVFVNPASFGFSTRTAGQCTKFIERILIGILGDDELVCFESNFLTGH
jgi:hypothetical protein